MLTDFLKSFAIVTLATAALASSVMAMEGNSSTLVDGTVDGVVSVNVSNIPSSGTVDTVLLIDTTTAKALDGTTALADGQAYGGTVYATAADATAADDEGAPFIVHIDETKIVESETGSNTFVINANLTEGHRYELRLGGLDDSDNGVTLRQYWFKVEGDAPITYNLSKQGGDGVVIGAKEFYADCERLLGNVAGDSNIDGQDTQAVLNHVSGDVPLSGEFLQAAEVEGDSNIDGQDAQAVLNYVADNYTGTVVGTTKVKNRSYYVPEKNADGSDLIVDAQGNVVTK